MRVLIMPKKNKEGNETQQHTWPVALQNWQCVPATVPRLDGFSIAIDEHHPPIVVGTPACLHVHKNI
jgi:hypothetical protein